MNKQSLIITHTIFTIITILFGFYIIYDNKKIHTVNNILDLTDNINEKSLIYINVLGDKQINFINYLSNPTDENFIKYEKSIKTEKEIKKSLQSKDSSMKELESKGYHYLEHGHSNIELIDIEKINSQLSESEKNILEKLENNKNTLNEIQFEKEKHNYINEIYNLYNQLDIRKKVQIFIDDHKQINVNILKEQTKKRNQTEMNLTILITLFMIISTSSILQLRKLK